LRIWFPVDRTDMRAIVLLENPHNHPVMEGKPSHESKDRYSRAVTMAGLLGATPGKVDKAPSTLGIFDGKTPAEYAAELGNKRIQRDIVRAMKKQAMPCGTGLPGVLEKKTSDQKLLKPEDQYIHWVECGDIPIIITFRVGLANLIHDAIETFHDNTYKRVAGSWIEWEWACWDRRINRRFTMLRAYTTRETREAFSRLWDASFTAIARATGREVRFKMFTQDGSGLRAVLLDGCKEQIEALGEYLAKRNDPPISGIDTTDPQELVKYLGKLCHVHFDRNMDKLANKCSDEIMRRVRRLPHLTTQAELDDFKMFCRTSKNKALADWFSDKERAPWFYALLNPNFSLMPRNDWDSTSKDTNLNESAHTATNEQTGIGLSLLEAIEGARTYDTQVEIDMRQATTSGIYANNLNTAQDRMTQAIRRKQRKTLKAFERHEAENMLYQLQDKVADVEQTKKATDAQLKGLREQLKTYRTTTGVKSKRNGKSTKGKQLMEEMAASNEASGSGIMNGTPREGVCCMQYTHLLCH
ncbi:hypothetical protein OH76DRAFT_1365979, partial [Lentinus brumalis]